MVGRCAAPSTFERGVVVVDRVWAGAGAGLNGSIKARYLACLVVDGHPSFNDQELEAS